MNSLVFKVFQDKDNRMPLIMEFQGFTIMDT